MNQARSSVSQSPSRRPRPSRDRGPAPRRRSGSWSRRASRRCRRPGTRSRSAAAAAPSGRTRMMRRMPPGSSRTRAAVSSDSNQPGGFCWNTAMPSSRRCRRTAARNSRRVPGSALIRVLASRTTSKARPSRSAWIGAQTRRQVGAPVEHRGGVVDPGDRVAERGQRAQDPAGAAAELEDRRARRHGRVHDLRLAERRQPRVELDRAPVVGDRAWPGPHVLVHGGRTASPPEAIPGQAQSKSFARTVRCSAVTRPADPPRRRSAARR